MPDAAALLCKLCPILALVFEGKAVRLGSVCSAAAEMEARSAGESVIAPVAADEGTRNKHAGEAQN